MTALFLVGICQVSRPSLSSHRQPKTRQKPAGKGPIRRHCDTGRARYCRRKEDGRYIDWDQSQGCGEKAVRTKSRQTWEEDGDSLPNTYEKWFAESHLQNGNLEQEEPADESAKFVAIYGDSSHGAEKGQKPKTLPVRICDG